MATKLWALMLVLVTTLLVSSAQILYKLGSANLNFDVLKILTNYYLIGGILLYAVGGILIILAFRGGEVSVLYPIIATSYIWVSFLSNIFLGEKINLWKWVGVSAIVLGIMVIGFGSKNSVAGTI